MKISEHCGDCAFWFPVEAGARIIGQVKRGDCFGVPPQVVPVLDKGQIVGGRNMRPQTAATDTACSLWADENEIEAPGMRKAANDAAQ